MARDEISQTELARTLGLSTQQIRNLEREGMPHRAEGRRKLYPRPGAVQWYVRRKQEEATAAVEPTDYSAARARRELARARLAEIEVAKEEGKLIPQEVVEEIYGTRLLDVVRSGILNMPGRWGAQVVGLSSPREGEALLKRVAAELLEELSSQGASAVELDGEDDVLPDDFPGRRALEEAGVESMAELLEIEDLRSVRGIGPATERKIMERLQA
jgi:phage terminase Nu1 subunit (DNA packaging protein)